MSLYEHYTVVTKNKRKFIGCLVGYDKFYNLSLNDCVEIIDTPKCSLIGCIVCQVNTKRWGYVNILGEDVSLLTLNE